MTTPIQGVQAIPPGVAAPTAPATSTTTANYTQQPPFDTRMRAVENPMSVGGSALFDRGFMVWDYNFAAAGGYSATNLPYVNFLFNPSTVQASYALSNSAAQAADLYGISTAGTAVAYVSLQQQMSFTIMFDRTYELNNPNNTGSEVGAMGCEVDVRAMKQFTGMFAAAAAYTGAAGSNIFANPGQDTGGQTIAPATGSGIGPQQGLMLMIPSYVYFGTPIGGAFTGGTSQYYGYVDAWSVQYTHYTAQMTPIRCVIDIEYTLLPLAGNAAGEIANSAVMQQAFNQSIPGTTGTTP